MSDEINEKLIKAAFKEAAKEWLDDIFAAFGKWSLVSLGAAALVALIFFLLSVNGWKHP